MQRIQKCLELLQDFVNKCKGPNSLTSIDSPDKQLHYDFNYNSINNYGEIKIYIPAEFESIKISYFENKFTAQIMTGDIGNFYLEWEDDFLSPKDNPTDFIKDIKEHIPIFAKALEH